MSHRDRYFCQTHGGCPNADVQSHHPADTDRRRIGGTYEESAANQRRKMMDRYEGVRIVEVSGLGEDALVVHAWPMTILLMEANLSCEDRMDIMAQVMDSEATAS